MIKISRLYLLLISLVCLQVTIAQSNYETLASEIDKILKYEFSEDQKFPDGYSIAIIDGDSSWILTRGHIPYSDSLLNQNAIFELAGLSKIICSTYLLYLEKDSLIDLNQNISINNLQNTTITNLINHQTGVPKFFKKFQNSTLSDPLASITSRQLLSALNTVRLNRAKKFQYSHHNYGILQWFLQENFSKKIQDLYHEWLSSHNVSPTCLNEDLNKLTSGISRLGKTSNATIYDGYWASLGVHSDIVFMKDFIQKLCLPIHRYRIKENKRTISKTYIDKNTYFMDGWYGLRLDKKRFIYSHAGRNKRHKVSIQMLPETSTAVIIFSNSELGTYDLSLHILRMLNANWKRS